MTRGKVLLQQPDVRIAIRQNVGTILEANNKRVAELLFDAPECLGWTWCECGGRSGNCG
jgi:hypothetical protein